MSLISAIAYHNKFVIVATDNKVVRWEYDPITFERTEQPTVETDLTSEKVFLLNDRLLFSTVGDTVGGNLLERLMYENVDSDDDLESAARILESILNQLTTLADDIEAAGRKVPWEYKCLQKRLITCSLYGFNHGNLSGGTYYDYDTGKVKVSYSSIAGPFIANCESPDPVEDRKIFSDLANISGNQLTVEDFIIPISYFHKKMSEKHIEVGTECFIHELSNIDGKIYYTNGSIDTKEIKFDFIEKSGVTDGCS